MLRICILLFVIGLTACTIKQAEPIPEVSTAQEKPVQVESNPQEAPILVQEPAFGALTPEEKLDSAGVEEAIKNMKPRKGSGEGEWILTGYVGSEEFIEDPDVLTLLPNGKYFVFNDFYGKANFPVIEKGLYKIDTKEKALTLKSRKLYKSGHSFLENESTTVRVKIRELTDDKIILCFTPDACGKFERLSDYLNKTEL